MLSDIHKVFEVFIEEEAGSDKWQAILERVGLDPSTQQTVWDASGCPFADELFYE
jgi:hypothetical protein